MAEDVSAYMRIAVTVYFTAALLAACVAVLSLCLNVFYNYNGKFVNAVVVSSDSSVNGMQSARYVSGAGSYGTICSSINSIDLVQIKWLNGTIENVYRYEEGIDNTIKLMTNYKNKRFQINVSDGHDIKQLKTVILTEVEQ